MSPDPVPDDLRRNGHSRRSFLRTSGGIATGIAVTVLPTGVVALASPQAASAETERVEPEGDMPPETVMAYVHDARNGVVTVVSGAGEKSYRDHALVKRLLDAAGTTAEEGR